MYTQITDLFIYGFTVEEIANLLDITIGKIHYFFYKDKQYYMSIKTKRKEVANRREDKLIKIWIKLFNSGLSESQIALKYNVAQSTVSKKIGKHVEPRHTKYDKHDSDYVDLYKAGNSIAYIAKKYNKQRCYISRHIKQYKNLRKKFTFESVKHEWIDLYKYGFSCREIGRLYGTSHSTVSLHVSSECEVTMRNTCKDYVDEWVSLYERGYTKSEISRMYNVSKTVVSKYFIKLGYSEPNLKYDYLMPKFIDLYNKGYSFKDIENETGINKGTVHNYFQIYGIQTRDYRESCKNRFVLQEDIFDNIDSNLKAFLLALIVGLTNLPKRDYSQTYKLVTACAESNKKYLDLLQKHLILNRDKDLSIKVDDRYILYVSSEKIYKLLIDKYKFQQKLQYKLYSIKFPDLTESQTKYFISALLTTRGVKVTSGLITYWSNKDFIVSMQNALLEFFNISTTIQRTDSRKNTNLYQIFIHEEDFKELTKDVEYI